CTDTGLAAGAYYYLVAAVDVAGNVGAPSGEASAAVLGDTNPPAVTITSPTDAATVSGTVTIAASASDDVGIAGVQFFVDGNAQGAEITSAPYSISWATRQLPNGAHILTARARDSGGNATTSSAVPVPV